MIEDIMFDNDYYAVFVEEEHEKEKRVRDNISRQAAIDAIKTWGLLDGLSEGQAIEILADTEKLPSTDRKGHWILCENQRQEDVDNGNYLFVCSECGFVDVHSKAVTVSFCWNCGADMRGEQNE